MGLWLDPPGLFLHSYGNKQDTAYVSQTKGLLFLLQKVVSLQELVSTAVVKQ